MVNEGAMILDEGIAQRASDIDVVWIYGYGWPRHTGGPMFWAEEVGLQKIVDDLNRYKDRLGTDFKLSPLLVRCAAEGTPLRR
jgi:3-hydroxyacyl-CoA dehydrogenase